MVLDGAIRQMKEPKGTWIEKRSETIHICRWQEIIHQRFHNSTWKFLEVLNKFSNMMGYKINLYKSTLFLHISNKQKQIVDTLQFTITTKKTKFLEINLIKKVKNLYNIHFKPLKKDIESGNASHAHELEIILWKWLFYQKLLTDSMQSQSNPISFFTDIEK